MLILQPNGLEKVSELVFLGTICKCSSFRDVFIITIVCCFCDKMAGIPCSRDRPNQCHNDNLKLLGESNMSSKTSSIISRRQKRAIRDMTFEERVQLGAETAVLCMGVTAQDRVFIITDYERENLAQRVASAFLVQELKVRHGHMIGIDEKLMAEGMCADYDEVFSLTNQVYDLVRRAKTIHVTSAKGSDVTATFHEDWHWIPCHGRYHQQGKWGNLPEGEVFTAPATVDGVLVCDVLGDHFSEKYGVLEHPVVITVKDGYVTSVTCEDATVANELRDYLFSVPNGNRAGEFAIGTLTSLKKFTGNLLQDEKMPGLHVAFGNPYPQFTGADWNAAIHVDVIPGCCTITVDGRVIMRDGEFTI